METRHVYGLSRRQDQFVEFPRSRAGQVLLSVLTATLPNLL